MGRVYKTGPRSEDYPLTPASLTAHWSPGAPRTILRTTLSNQLILLLPGKETYETYLLHLHDRNCMKNNFSFHWLLPSLCSYAPFFWFRVNKIAFCFKHFFSKPRRRNLKKSVQTFAVITLSCLTLYTGILGYWGGGGEEGTLKGFIRRGSAQKSPEKKIYSS